MTQYQQTLSKRGHTRGGPNYQTGLLPAAVPAASTVASWIGSLGIGTAVSRLGSKLISGGKAVAKKGKSTAKKGGSAAKGSLGGSNAVDVATVGITGFTLGDLTGGKLPGPLGGYDIGNLALGAGLLAGSAWLGIQGEFRLDTPLTPVSGAGMAAGGLLLYNGWAKAKSKENKGDQ